MKGIKFLIFLAFLLSAGSLVGNWVLYRELLTERLGREELESQHAQLEDRSAFLESQITQYEKENERLRAQVKDYTDQREVLKKELNQAREEAGRLRKELEALRLEQKKITEKENLETETEKAIVEEAKRLPPIPASAAPTPEPVPAPKEVKEVKEKKAPPKKEPVSPSPAIVDEQPNQVLSVNREFNFVVVNVGLRDRVKMGDTLRVEQKGKFVGRIQVEKLYENFSACKILEEIKPARIREGDLVRVG